MQFGSATSTTDTYTRAGLLGIVAGLRSQIPFFLLAVAGNQDAFAKDAERPLSIFRSRGALVTFGALALGEVIADKLPVTPSRLDPGPLGGRLVSGALVGAAVSHEAGASALVGGAIGAVGAGVGSFVGNRFRLYFARLLPVPDLIGALVEDASALALGRYAVQRRTD